MKVIIKRSIVLLCLFQFIFAGQVLVAQKALYSFLKVDSISALSSHVHSKNLYQTLVKSEADSEASDQDDFDEEGDLDAVEDDLDSGTISTLLLERLSWDKREKDLISRTDAIAIYNEPCLEFPLPPPKI